MPDRTRQRDGIDIGVVRIVRGEFTGSAQQVQSTGARPYEPNPFPGSRLPLTSEHGPGVDQECVVIVGASAETIDICCGTVEFGPACVLHSNSKIQPAPGRRG